MKAMNAVEEHECFVVILDINIINTNSTYKKICNHGRYGVLRAGSFVMIVLGHFMAVVAFADFMLLLLLLCIGP